MPPSPSAVRREKAAPTEVEQALKEIKHERAIRPISHSTEERIEA